MTAGSAGSRTVNSVNTGTEEPSFILALDAVNDRAQRIELPADQSAGFEKAMLWSLVPSHDGMTIPPEAFAERIDSRTALVVTTHLFYTTGYLQNVRAIADAAHAAGALCVIDGYQTCGCVPLDGLGMLVNQGVIGIRLWTGVDADPAVMRDALAEVFSSA